MTMTENGISLTQVLGSEQFESFTNRGKRYYQYDYRHTDWELFSCVKSTVDACRAARDAWLAQKISH